MPSAQVDQTRLRRHETKAQPDASFLPSVVFDEATGAKNRSARSVLLPHAVQILF